LPFTTTGQETERVYSYNPGARTGPHVVETDEVSKLASYLDSSGQETERVILTTTEPARGLMLWRQTKCLS